MKTRMISIIFLVNVFLLVSLTVGFASDRGRKYKITITNITHGQIVSPPIVFSHNRNFKLFKLGKTADDALAQLAEDGLTGPLESQLLASSSVGQVIIAQGGLEPGASVDLELETHRSFRFFSAAGMLVSSNDAFFAANRIRLPWGGGAMVHFAPAYDAGSEVNSESCAYIPGPPCGNPESRDPDGAENFVHIHPGIHGIGDLSPEVFDWRNPVVKIQIQAIR